MSQSRKPLQAEIDNAKQEWHHSVLYLNQKNECALILLLSIGNSLEVGKSGHRVGLLVAGSGRDFGGLCPGKESRCRSLTLCVPLLHKCRCLEPDLREVGANFDRVSLSW